MIDLCSVMFRSHDIVAHSWMKFHLEMDDAYSKKKNIPMHLYIDVCMCVHFCAHISFVYL